MSPLDNIRIVLVNPVYGGNVGSACRAMMNMGLSQLVLVDPRPGMNMEDAAQMACHAGQILANRKVFDTTAEAVADCTLVVGTGTITYRKPEQPVIQLPELAPLVSRELARGGSVAMVFGSEKHGLTREDLSYCHLLVEIPTDPQQPSMNLGQAVAVCLY